MLVLKAKKNTSTEYYLTAYVSEDQHIPDCVYEQLFPSYSKAPSIFRGNHRTDRVLTETPLLIVEAIKYKPGVGFVDIMYKKPDLLDYGFTRN